MRRISPSRRILASLLALLAASVAGEGQADHQCQLTVAAAQGDTCFSLAATWGISVTTFLNNNPTVSSCSRLNVGSNYCIDAEAPDSGANTPQDTNPGELYVSTDGTCGGGITCKGSKWGDCCSGHGWCGGTADHCGAECNPAFGVCAGGVSGPAPPVSSTKPATTSAKPAPPVVTSKGANTPPVEPVGTGGVRVTTTVYETRYSTSVVMQTRFASMAITNTVYTSVVSTSTRTALAVITTTAAITTTARSTLVVTSTRLDTQRVTRTMTQTEIDTSIITTITTLTLTVSGVAAAELCSRFTRSALINDARVQTLTALPDNCMLQISDCDERHEEFS